MKFKKTISAFLLCAFSVFLSFAIKVPELTGPVVDKAGLLSREQFSALDSELRAISRETGTQIAVLTIPTLEGLDIETYTMAVAEKWKIGSSENDNGVILCVALKEKKIRIEVGYGLEGSLTDAKCGLIIRNIIAPKFQNGKYGEGIVEAVRTIESIAGVGDVKYAENLSSQDDEADISAFPIVIFFILFYIIMISGALSTKFPGLRWLPWAFLFRGNGRRSSNHHNDFFGGFGGGHGGSSFGGGFSGGGGGFGGGGASGGW